MEFDSEDESMSVSSDDEYWVKGMAFSNCCSN